MQQRLLEPKSLAGLAGRKAKQTSAAGLVFKQTLPRLQNEKFSITETLKASVLSILLYHPLKKKVGQHSQNPSS